MKYRLPISSWKVITILSVAAACILSIAATWLLFHRGDRIFGGSAEIKPEQREQIMQMGDSAITTLDVPVAALLLYKGEIIGTGYNTVIRDDDPSGHAEINSIRHAMRDMGYKAFNRLDRDSLTLITSFEPCAMCRGAIINQRIKNVQYIKPKSFGYLFREDLQMFKMQINRLKLNPSHIQDSLFHRHPGFEDEE